MGKIAQSSRCLLVGLCSGLHKPRQLYCAFTDVPNTGVHVLHLVRQRIMIFCQLGSVASDGSDSRVHALHLVRQRPMVLCQLGSTFADAPNTGVHALHLVRQRAMVFCQPGSATPNVFYSGVHALHLVGQLGLGQGNLACGLLQVVEPPIEACILGLFVFKFFLGLVEDLDTSFHVVHDGLESLEEERRILGVGIGKGGGKLFKFPERIQVLLLSESIE
ncbi:hypothetical protein PG988_011905 [Apiospora saccharicola]